MQDKIMEHNPIEKSKPHVVTEVIEYIPGATMNKTIIRKNTGSIVISSFDAGHAAVENISAFDIYIQVVEGTTGLITGGQQYRLETGQGIIIPAHNHYQLGTGESFKILSTIIKSGYEEMA